MTAADKYKGEDGGLYGGGKNEPPEVHQAAAKKETAKIVPLDADGKPDPDGKIALVSISMSNATMEFSLFKQIADADPQKSPLLTIVDCAQGGQAMAQWVDPRARAWTEADRRLVAAHVSPEAGADRLDQARQRRARAASSPSTASGCRRTHWPSCTTPGHASRTCASPISPAASTAATPSAG